MRAEQNFAEALASKKSRLGAFEFYFFEFLAALAFEFIFRKCRIAREFIHYGEERLGKFRKARERNGAGIGSGVRRKIGTEAAQVFLNLAADAFCGSRPNDGGGHLRESGGAI